jgi:hypothetical protein
MQSLGRKRTKNGEGEDTLPQLPRSPLSGKTLAKLGNNCASNLFYYRFFCDYLFFKSIENEPMFELLPGGFLYFFGFTVQRKSTLLL